MDISIIILNYKTSGLVKQSLKKLYNMDVSFSYEIIVVDNNSNDGCIQMINDHFPKVTGISNSKNLGFGAGNNVAIKQAKGEYILILNPDVAVIPEEITKLYKFLTGRSDIALVGPRLLNPDGSIQSSSFRFPSTLMPIYSRTALKRISLFKKKLDSYRMEDFDHNSTSPVHWLVGGCLLFKKSVFIKIGMFDERYFMYYEDIDLCRRLWERGFKVYYYPGAEMVHYHHRQSAEESLLKSFKNKTLYYHLSSWIKYVLKYLGKSTPQIEK